MHLPDYILNHNKIIQRSIVMDFLVRYLVLYLWIRNITNILSQLEVIVFIMEADLISQLVNNL